MTNIMKADIKRLSQGYGVYITFAILIIFAGMHVFGAAEAFNTDYLNSGFTAPLYFMNLNQNVIFKMIAIVHLLSVVDFSTNTVKNTLISGSSRVTYYISKLITALLFLVFMYIVQIVTGTLMVTLSNGFGGTFSLEWIGSFAVGFLSQLFMLVAVSSIFTMLAFIARGSHATLLMISVILVPLTVVQLIAGINEYIGNMLLNFEIITMTMRLTRIDYLETYEIMRTLSIGLGFIIFSIFASVTSFKRAEIK